MSDYSGWMPSQIKIELRRRGARASGQKAVVRVSSNYFPISHCHRYCVESQKLYSNKYAIPMTKMLYCHLGSHCKLCYVTLVLCS